jgi:methyl-accepting chemotaxis protein
MKLDREALVSPKLLVGGGILLLGFSLIAMLYVQTFAMGDEIIQALQAANPGDLSPRVEQLMAERDGRQTLASVVSILFAVMIAIVAIAVSQSIIGPLRRTIEYAGGIAEGKLGDRAEFWASGEVANVRDAVSDMQEQLTQVVQRVSSAADEVSHGSAAIDRSAGILNSHFEVQASSLARVTGKMKLIAGSIREKADESSKINTLVHDTHDNIKTGGRIVEKTVAAMEEIHKSSTQINDIVGIIDEIAFQTNLLALNAAVEAARSGEHGRGFAVVANEVRNLAQRSAEAASQIKALIEDSVRKVNDGSSLAKASGDTLSQILSGFDEVTDCISQLTEQSEQEARNVDGIIVDVNEVEQLVSEGAKLVQNVGSSSELLNRFSAHLNEIVGYFKVNRHHPEEARGQIRPAKDVSAIPEQNRRQTAPGKRRVA